MSSLDNVRYPIGRFTSVAEITEPQRCVWIAQIAGLPKMLGAAVEGLNDSQLNQCYRPDGWTVRQVVHHLADEHLNGYAYFKMALTEDDPVVKTYDEPAWARTKDSSDAPIEWSLTLLEGLHARWALLLKTLDGKDFALGYIHRRGRISLDDAIQLYAWHCLHHTAHITRLREREGW